MECWAAVLGDCKGKQSREHYMSAGLWKGRTVWVRGFAWLGGQDKEIGVGSLQSRILCEYHNRELSPLDAEAQRVLETLEQIILTLRTNATLKPRNAYRKPKTWYVDGPKFERWAAKFLIGLICAEEGDAKSGTTPVQKEWRPQLGLFKPYSIARNSRSLLGYTSQPAIKQTSSAVLELGRCLTRTARASSVATLVSEGFVSSFGLRKIQLSPSQFRLQRAPSLNDTRQS
jgi:hypothetical protein